MKGYPIRPIVELGPPSQVTRIVVYKNKPKKASQATKPPSTTNNATRHRRNYTISNGLDEFCLIESSVNSVRVSFRFKQDGIIDPVVVPPISTPMLEIPIATAVPRDAIAAASSVRGRSGGDNNDHHQEVLAMSTTIEDHQHLRTQQEQQAKNASNHHLPMNALEKAILTKYRSFFQYDADTNHILRRKPVPGYSISFLIVPNHLETIGREEIIDSILGFVEHLDKEINRIKLNINSQARRIATAFFQSF